MGSYYVIGCYEEGFLAVDFRGNCLQGVRKHIRKVIWEAVMSRNNTDSGARNWHTAARGSFSSQTLSGCEYMRKGLLPWWPQSTLLWDGSFNLSTKNSPSPHPHPAQPSLCWQSASFLKLPMERHEVYSNKYHLLKKPVYTAKLSLHSTCPLSWDAPGLYIWPSSPFNTESLNSSWTPTVFLSIAMVMAFNYRQRLFSTPQLPSCGTNLCTSGWCLHRIFCSSPKIQPWHLWASAPPWQILSISVPL